MSAPTAVMPVTCTPMPWKSAVLAYMIVNGIMALLMTLVVCGRIYARVTGAGLGIDDWLATLSWVRNNRTFNFDTNNTVTVLALTDDEVSNCGSGYQIIDAMVNVPLILRLSFAFQLIVLYAACFSKLSVLFFYTRVFQVKGLMMASHLTQALIGSWTLAFTMAIVFSCTPVYAQWDMVAQATATCINQVRMFLGLIISNAALDLLIMAIPIRSILQLQMRLTDKIGVLTCILLGLIAVIAAVARGAYTASVDFTNITGTMPVSVFLSTLEPILSIICISLPPLRPLWRRYRGDPSSGAGTMELSEYSHHSSSRGMHRSKGIRVTKDTSINYRSKETEHGDQTGLHFDESGSERNLTTTVTGANRWSK
ncbi:unnamed protein product [Clonostachys byssicola]|uniref:Rhodopsin domain-containing protein n=1 Tax=Clonostachys byssicola TaxID=160290 RepID=A0A9N9Y7A9_9HYPO|nr:unnamed protein product [Clonostachys byssicola]